MEPCETPGMIVSKSLVTLLLRTHCFYLEDINAGKEESFHL